MDTDDQAVDPICGMQVDPDTALSSSKDSETFYFCSRHCQEKFESMDAPVSGCCQQESSGEKVKPTSSANYYCPMCEGIESDQPGDCPKCGMALEPTHFVQPAQETIYTCPMHPEVEQDQPGACPICGMDLEPKYVLSLIHI